ncbi:MAG: hypothetical protein IPJ24_13755 [bacterium]|nr:hypothetical protein [bacterium]
MFRLRRPNRAFLSTICLLLAAAAAQGQETILQNDAFVDGQSAAFQGGFVAGETAAVRLSPPGPFPMSVTRVQFLFGGATTTQVVTLRIWDDSAGAAAPGTELYSGDFELTGSDTAMQEIDLSAANLQVGGPFRVGIEFQHSGAPSVARDGNGITAARNFIDAQGLGWFDAAVLGVTGDWIIRAGVQPLGGGGGGPVVQNDSFVPGQSAGFQGGFVAGETAAARLLPTGTFPQQVSAVRFLFGGAAGTRTVTLRIWDDPTGAAAPGVELYSGDFEVTAADNALQELDLSAAALTVGGPFRVGIEFQHDGTPSVARDGDGITAGRNFMDVMGFGWADAALFGITGDWIIRAVMGTNTPEPGEPAIISIADIARDQGRSVRVRFARSAQDAPGAATPITSYEVYRRADALKGVNPPADPGEAAALLDGWDYVGSAPAHGENIYSLVVPTLADSTIADGQHWSVFLVRAATASPYVFFDSAPDSGWSVDNLAPSAPAGLALAGGVLSWAPSAAADFDYYSVYASDFPALDGSAVLVGRTTALALATGAQGRAYFLVTATDFAGNEGPSALLLAASATGEPTPARDWNLTARPNPFNPRTTIVFALAAAADARLDVYTLDGAHVRSLVRASLGAGPHESTWDGRDDGGLPVATGIYVARLRAGGQTLTYRLALVR